MPQSNALLRDVDAQAEPQAAQPQAFELRPLPGPLGAEIIGLDLSRELTREDFPASIRRTWTIICWCSAISASRRASTSISAAASAR